MNSPTTQAKSIDDDQGAFEHARLDLLETGFLLAAYETLILALKDRRLHQGHRCTMAELISHMNRRTGTTWIGRDYISQKTGLPVRSVSNFIAELMRFGYVIAENRRTPEANNRSLRHYTLAGLDKAEIERLLEETIKGIRSKTPRSVAKVMSPHDFESHAIAGQIVEHDTPKSSRSMNKSHVRACTVTNHIELTKKKGEEAFAVAASDNAADNPLIRVQAAATHQHTDMLCSNEDGAAIVIAKLGMASLTKSQRDKVADTLTKAAMRWRGLRGRHDLYMSASDWFAAEWMPRLREDLAKLADVATPRRFTSDLERSTIFGSCSPQLALTKDGINAQLDAADKLTGEEAPSILRDFEACKMNVGTIGSIPYAIAIEALRRTGSDPTNLSAEQTAAIKAALSDVDPQLLTIALADLKSVCGDSRYGLTRFGYEGRTLLMRPSRVICTAIAACRAAVAVLAQDRAKQLKIHNDQRQRQSFNEPDQFEYRPSCGLQFPWPKPTVP